MRTVDHERVEERRRQIRRAALTCFRRSGFHQASMAEICDEAGMSPGNLYRYYDSKEAIIEAICEDERRELTRRFAAVGSSADLLDAMLELAGDAMAASTQPGKRRLAIEILAEAVRNRRVGEIVRQHNAALLAVCVETIERAQALGQADPGLDPAIAASLLMGAAEGLGIRLALQPHLDREACIAAFKTLVRRFLRPQR
ncbi:MAG TPA: TetR/AcrR family transcriptional regulator [Stellaceae bacterium]|nr:TetR/AcrR family transcriptional regulator [Stellaceae bacterium]